ncbi:glycosyltransferase family 4 protein [Bifidobacterium callimiconis]|uniref:glycosyltransferase family 4 protein n=1 Tax=Bifidobacterium callimiconis TaxID=2306973 RepID=UPI001BDD59F5|nr:glycosyltransferase family 4 protein [Bifidobacterium callimiconis]MBT1177304.1 glycosyltransferase family 4 protein [Bifidobacterium callimiconis]
MSLVKQNEIEQRMDLTVVSIADPDAENTSHRYSHTRFLFIPKSIRIVDILYHYWQAAWKRLFSNSHIIASLFYRQVLHAIRKDQYDAVVFEGGESYGFKAYDKIFHGKLWYHVHANPEKPVNSAYFNDVMVLSNYVLHNWRTQCIDHTQHLHVLHNGIDTSLFRQAITPQENASLREQYGFQPDDFIVLYCGRLFSGKGVKELTQAVASIQDPSVKLLIVGYAHDTDARRYQNELEAIAETTHGRVKITGYIPNEDVFRFYHAANIQVVPSLWEEGAGNICIEGMAAGLPIIATRSGGMPEYLSSECSILVDRGDAMVKDIATQILELKNNPEKCQRMAQFAQKHAEKFSENAYYSSYVDLLEKKEEFQ